MAHNTNQSIIMRILCLVLAILALHVPVFVRAVVATQQSSSALVSHSDWTHVARVPPSNSVSFMMAMHHGQHNEILQAWEQVSDPRHPHYLHYPTREHLQTLAKPQPHHLAAIEQWIDKEVCSEARKTCTVVWSPFKDTVLVRMAASDMESFLGGAEIHTYRHARRMSATWTRTSLTSLMPFIPTHIHSAVAYVHGLSHWPALVEAQTVKRNNRITKQLQEENLARAATISTDSKPNDEAVSSGSFKVDPSIPDLPSFGVASSELLASSTWDPAMYFINTRPTRGNVDFLLYLFCSPTSTANVDIQAHKIYCGGNPTQRYFQSGTVTLTPVNGDPIQMTFNISMVVLSSTGIPSVKHSIALPNLLPYKMNVALSYVGFDVSIDYPYMVQAMGDIIPPQLKSFYGIPANLSASANTKLGIAAEGLGGDSPGFYNPADLVQFLSAVSLPPNGNVVYKDFSSNTEPNDPTRPDGETTMDIQIGMGILASSEASGVIYHASALNGSEALVDLMNGIMLDSPLPSVLSISYGEMLENSYTQMIINHTNTRFQMLGLLGVTVVISSGDHGAYRPLPSFSNIDPSITCLGFNPSYPGSSPYITSVGSSVLKVDHAGDCPREIQCSLETGAAYTAGGGFSISQPAPYFQTAAINHWLNDATCQAKRPQVNYYDPTKRALPDLVIMGMNYDIFYNGTWIRSGGTSASAPAFAAFIALINDLRVASGQPVLGPVNGLLYYAASTDPRTFQDVTEGGNRCLETGCCPDGYNACTGFDPVTGLGAPRFQYLQQFFNVSLGKADPNPIPECRPQSSSSSTGGASATTGTTGGATGGGTGGGTGGATGGATGGTTGGATGSDASSTGGATGTGAAAGGDTGTTSGTAFYPVYLPTEDDGARRTLLIVIAVVSSLAAIFALALIGMCLFRGRQPNRSNQESANSNISIGMDSLSVGMSESRHVPPQSSAMGDVPMQQLA